MRPASRMDCLYAVDASLSRTWRLGVRLQACIRVRAWVHSRISSPSVLCSVLGWFHPYGVAVGMV